MNRTTTPKVFHYTDASGLEQAGIGQSAKLIAPRQQEPA